MTFTGPRSPGNSPASTPKTCPLIFTFSYLSLLQRVIQEYSDRSLTGIPTQSSAPRICTSQYQSPLIRHLPANLHPGNTHGTNGPLLCGTSGGPASGTPSATALLPLL